jgi:hypothetical protein
MNAYIYQGALLCEGCAEKVRQHKQETTTWARFSDNEQIYPQGPDSDGGGKADSPQHCDHCGVFLENPLTSAGEEYVKETCQGPVSQLNAIELEWRERYSYLFREDS